MSYHEGYLWISHGAELQSTMQGGVPEGKQSFSETGDDKFEEIVRKIRLITIPFP